MQTFFASGHAVDVVLAVIAVEAAWLVGTRRMSPWSAVLVLGPGVFILLGVRAALVGAEWWWVSLALLASFPLHLLDLRRRLHDPSLLAGEGGRAQRGRMRGDTRR